jgi:hypothetical protein
MSSSLEQELLTLQEHMSSPLEQEFLTLQEHMSSPLEQERTHVLLKSKEFLLQG